MLFRLDPCGIFCVLMTYAAVIYADYVFIHWLIRLTFGETVWGMVHIMIFNVLLLLLVISHLRAMVADPGIVPRSSPIDFSEISVCYSYGKCRKEQAGPRKTQKMIGNSNKNFRKKASRDQSQDHDSDSDISRSSLINQSEGENWTVCGRCEAYRPPRAHHCRICNRCIRKMDHHCPWINNCVGEMNQKYFIQFLIYTGSSCVYCIAIVIAAWFLSCESCHSDDVKHLKVLHSIFVTVECLLFILFVVAVSCDQFQSILNDETAIEQVQRRGSFTRGKSKLVLLRDVCGAGPVIFWMLPCHQISQSTKEVLRLPAYYNV